MEITCEKTKCTAIVDLLFSDEHGRHEARGTVRMSDAITKQMTVSGVRAHAHECRVQPVRWLHGTWSTRMFVASVSTLADSRVLYEAVTVPEYNITHCYGFR